MFMACESLGNDDTHYSSITSFVLIPAIHWNITSYHIAEHKMQTLAIPMGPDSHIYSGQLRHVVSWLSPPGPIRCPVLSS